MERKVTLDCWVVKGSWLGHLSRKCRRARSIKKKKNTKSRKNGGGFFSSSCFYFSTVLAFDPPYYFLCYTAVGGLYDIGMNLSRTVEEWRVIAYITCDNGRLGVVASLFTIVSLLFLKRIPLVYVFETFFFSSLSFFVCSFFFIHYGMFLLNLITICRQI